MDSHTLGRHLRDLVVDKMTALERQFPGFRLPRVYAGHLVGDDAACHLLKTLTLLLELGIEEVGDVDIRRSAFHLVETIDPSIDGFSAFGFGESAVRLGGLDVVADLDRVVDATRSPELLRRIVENDNPPPPNWVMVVARCLAAEAALTGDRPAELDDFLDRTRQLLTERPSGWIDDMPAPLIHHDMYTPDMYVFSEPLAAELGDTWRRTFARVLVDLDTVAHRGGAIVWGRSSGLMALALTVELAAVTGKHRIAPAPGPWPERARQAARELDRLMPDGVVAAHQHRSTMFYRGPARRLQMSFDILDKLAASARDLLSVPEFEGGDRSAAWPDENRLVTIDDETGAAVWSYRSRPVSFAIPFMRGFHQSYDPALHGPGLFDNPTEGHPCFVPLVYVDGAAVRPMTIPARVEHHTDGSLTVDQDGWTATAGKDRIEGKRRATYCVEGRTVSIDEEVELPSHFGEVTITIPQIEARRLEVEVEGGGRIRTIDTDGIAEWRSYWNPIPTVHQIEMPLVEGRANWRWSVRPQIRVASTIHGHPYDASLYSSLTGRLQTSLAPRPSPELFDQLADVDVLHMAWPEWWSGVDPTATAEAIRAVRDSGVRVLWTQHNLEPHFFKTEEARTCYQQWAELADAVIHHTEWGKGVALDRYTYGPNTEHFVIPHGHWGHRYDASPEVTRSDIERQCGWPPAPIRLAVVGMPRAEKRIQDVIDAVHACSRDDLQLVIRIEGEESVPDDPRIIIDRGHIPDSLYHRRMAAIDALILPFDPEGMLTTGTAFDAIGAGVATITSEWAFFDETFEGHDIRYGSTVDDLRDCLEGVDADRLAVSAAGMGEIRERFEWTSIADQTLALLEDLCP